MWWAPSAPAPASESNVNNTTTAGQQKAEKDNKGQKDERRKTTRTHRTPRDKLRRTAPKGQQDNMRGARQEENTRKAEIGWQPRPMKENKEAIT